MTGPATLEAIRSAPEGDAYPRDVLTGCTDALVLFAAGFHGKQDAFCPTGAFVRCSRLVGDWCRLARRAVVLGVGENTPLSPPDGWTLTEKRWRSDYDGGVYWAVLERS